MVDGHQLHDEAAHRRAHDVRGADAQRIEQTNRVIGEIIERIRRLPVTRQRGHDVGLAGLLHLRREAAVSIVEPDDVETPGGELLAEGLVPAEHLRAQPHDEKQRRGIRIAKRLVFDFDAVGVSSWHAPNAMTYP